MAQPLPLVGGAYKDDARPWSMQDTCNWLPTTAERNGTRSPDKLKTPPGLLPFVEVIQTTTGILEYSPVRGLHEAEGRLFAVIGRTMYRITNDGVAIPLGSVPGTGRVVMDHNQISLGNEIIAVNGSAGYVYNTTTNTLARITDTGYPGASVVRFVDGFLVQIEPQGRYAFNSDPADATSYNTLDRFTSEVKPDRLLALAVVGNELLLFSTTSGEFFQNTGASEQPFRSKRIAIDKGAAGAYVVAEADNTCFWLSSEGVFYQLEGYSPRRISTRPIEQAIRGLNWAQAYAFVWEDEGHTVIYWTFPDGQTWGYDVSEREWHRRESYGLSRWRVNNTARFGNRWIAGDFQKGRLWVLDWDYPWEGDTEFESSRTLGVIHDNQGLMLHDRLELVMDTGQPLVDPVAFDPQPELICLWGEAFSGGGPALNKTETFNTELSAASVVKITGYWPNAYAYTYPPTTDPLEVTTSDYGTYTVLNAPISLTLGTGAGTDVWALGSNSNDIPDGQILATVSVDGTEFIAAINNNTAS